jgi:hypothetical protein
MTVEVERGDGTKKDDKKKVVERFRYIQVTLQCNLQALIL